MSEHKVKVLVIRPPVDAAGDWGMLPDELMRQVQKLDPRIDAKQISILDDGQNGAEAAKRFLRRLLRSHGTSPRKIVTDKLGSYGVARRALMPETIHSNDRYANNRAKLSHQPTRARERGMRPCSSPRQAQRFPSAHAVVYNLFNLQRHLPSAAVYRFRRARAFKHWNEAVAA